EQGAEVYSAAGTEAQAMMTFAPAWRMAKRNDALVDYFNLKLTGTPKNPTSIYREEDMSTMMPVVGKPGDGSSPHCGLVDEYHEAPTSVAYDTLDTGMGARDQPILEVITTAGVNTSFPCYDLHIEAVKVLEGTIIDETLFVMVFGIDKDDDWQDFEVWKKVNPNYGVSINKDYLWGKFQDALNKPTQRNILLTKHLNIWQNAGVGFLDMLRWNKCVDENLKPEDFLGQECWLALDLASKIDLAALVMLFKHKRRVINANCPKCYSDVEIVNGFNICTGSNKLEDGTICGWGKPVMRDCIVGFARHYLPEETVLKKENQHYQKWDLEGHLIVTEGARTDFHRIEEDIKKLDRQFIVKELTFDPKEASYLIQNIQQWSSFECIEFEQGPATISQPMKELEAQVMAMEFWHNGDPVYTWCMGNVIKKKARSGGSVKHYFPTKENDNLKIDSAVATICALGRLISYDEDEGAYDSRVAAGEESIVRVL
ncbi:terminase large subunit, partial [Candidatus Pacearchaeota archaeon]|nr:terminase large subunit [Candidatus Pacearchaeota archaeon]